MHVRLNCFASAIDGMVVWPIPIIHVKSWFFARSTVAFCCIVCFHFCTIVLEVASKIPATYVKGLVALIRPFSVTPQLARTATRR